MQDNFSAEQPNYFAVIPANVRYDKNLSSSEKLFYSEIAALAQRDGRCWASRRYFANLYNVDEKTISRWTTKLAEKGYIEVRVIRNAQNVILRRNITLKVFHSPTDKNVPDNNTSNNNKKVSKAQSKHVENFDSIIQKSTESTELRESLVEFVKFRKLIKKPMTNKALELIIAKLKKLGQSDRERVAILNQSIERGWAGVFSLKDEELQSKGYQVDPRKLYNMPESYLKEIPE